MKFREREREISNKITMYKFIIKIFRFLVMFCFFYLFFKLLNGYVEFVAGLNCPCFGFIFYFWTKILFIENFVLV